MFQQNNSVLIEQYDRCLTSSDNILNIKISLHIIITLAKAKISKYSKGNFSTQNHLNICSSMYLIHTHTHALTHTRTRPRTHVHMYMHTHTHTHKQKQLQKQNPKTIYKKHNDTQSVHLKFQNTKKNKTMALFIQNKIFVTI
jgi:hypothetical protein